MSPNAAVSRRAGCYRDDKKAARPALQGSPLTQSSTMEWPGPPTTPPVFVPFTFSPEPGIEFLLARLQRAQAVPPARCTPEVAAFVEAMQLEEEVCALLPLVLEHGADVDDLPSQRCLPTRQRLSACCWRLASLSGWRSCAAAAAYLQM